MRYFRALQERNCALGSDYVWPPTTSAWTSGTITAMTATQMTDSTRVSGDWVKTGGSCTGPRWSGWHCDSAPFQVPSYYVVLDSGGRDETKILVAHIVGNDDTHLAIADIITDHITAGYIDSASYYVGKQYAITNGQGIGLWWHQRTPDFPNDVTHYEGDSTSVTSLTVSGSLVGNLKDKVIFWGTGFTSAATIIENTATNVVIGRQSTAPSGSYQIRDGSTVLFSGTISSNQDGIQQAGQQFVKNMAGKSLLIYGGALRRISIASNTLTTILFARQSSEVSGSYIIVDSTGRGYPGRRGYSARVSYSGGAMPYYTVRPDDDFTHPESVSAQNIPVAEYPWDEPKNDGTGCERVYHDSVGFGDAWGLAGIDIHVANDAECDQPDKFYAPNLYKSRNGLQSSIEGFAVAGFIKPGISYVGRKEINPFSQASLMRYNDINWNDASASVSPVTDTDGNVVGGHVEFTGITQPYPGQPYKYDLTDSNLDRRITTGQGSGTSLAFDVDKKYVGESLTLTYSFGWTRYEPRMVRAMYSADAFIPDIDQGDGEFTEPSVIDPANVKDYCHEDDDPPPDECPHDCFGTGQWIRRGPSTTYLIADDLDRMTDGGEAFVAGDLVRYMGGNWSDPGIDPQTLTEDHDLTIGYWRNFTEMKRTPVQQRIIDRAKKGVVTQGGKWFLTDSSQDWHGYPFGGGDGRVISGTTTAGGSTSITDSTIADEENEERCYFDAGRFVGYSAAYAGFTLEVDPIDDGTSSSSADGEAPPPVVKFPILSANQSGVITIPSYCGASFVAGQSYRIREPKWNLNRWQGRKLIITQPDGTKLTTTVAGNDRDTLFFAPLSVDIEEGATFEIVEFKIGGVYKRTSSGWIEPSGSDPRGQDFHKDVHENAPTIIKRYGRARQHDHWTLVYEQELFKTIDSLRWTVRDFGWTGRADPDVPEVNLFSIEGQNYLGNQCWSNIDDLHTMLDNYWLAPRAGSPDEGYTIGVIAAIRESYSMTCPHCDEFTKEESGWWFSYGGPPAAHWNWANADAADSGYVVGFNVTRGYAYPTLGGMCKFISRSIDFLIYTTAFCSPNPSPFYPAIDNRWASFGDPVVEDSFGLVTSMTTTAESVIGPKVGDTTPEIPRPNDLMYPQYSQICDYETGGDYHTSIGAYYTGGCRGYQIISSKAVLKWSFDYVT